MTTETKLSGIYGRAIFVDGTKGEWYYTGLSNAETTIAAHSVWVQLRSEGHRPMHEGGRVSQVVIGEPGCEACEREPAFQPSHYGSSLCECGSLASGGDRAHCSCDGCF